MKTIRVVSAIICDDLTHPTKIFATQKGYGEFKGKWEFPGGKIEEGETSVEALAREIREELDVEIEIGDLVAKIEYDYPVFHLSMDCFFCLVKERQIVLKEAMSSKWLTKDNLTSVDWVAADGKLIEILSGELFER